MRAISTHTTSCVGLPFSVIGIILQSSKRDYENENERKPGSRIASYQPPEKPLKKFKVTPKFVDAEEHRDLYRLPKTGDMHIEFKPAFPAGDQARFKSAPRRLILGKMIYQPPNTPVG